MSKLGRLPSSIILCTGSDKIRNNAGTDLVRRFVDFGSMPCFIGLWELAKDPERQKVLQDAYTVFCNTYAANLELPGPYLRARFTENTDDTMDAWMTVNQDFGTVRFRFPKSKLIYFARETMFHEADITRTAPATGWYFITPGYGTLWPKWPIIVSELVPGALAPVKWEEVFVGRYSSHQVTRFWRAIPPTPDYVAMGCVGLTGTSASSIPKQPPPELADRFRAVHKRALTGAKQGVHGTFYGDEGRKIYGIDGRYWFAGYELPFKEDCFRLDPKGAQLEGDGW
jgi:hypothetical protein